MRLSSILRLRRLALAIISGALAACQREPVPQRPDTSAQQLQASDTVVHDVNTPSAWDARAGAFFLIPTGQPDSGYLVAPEYSSESSLDTVTFPLQQYERTDVTLLRDGVAAGTARVDRVWVDKVEDCPAWPRVHLVPSGATAGDWSIAVTGQARALPSSTLSSMSAKDSIRLAVAVARLASGLPGDTSTAFRGRPFVVRQLAVVRADSAPLLVAEVIRSIDQEAMPLQEHLLFIAEEDPGRAGSYVAVYHERAIGPEEAVETTEPLVVLTLDNRTLLLLVSRELGEGVVYAAIERSESGHWRVRWTSAYAGC